MAPGIFCWGIASQTLYTDAWASCLAWVLAGVWLRGLLSQGEKAQEGTQEGYGSSNTAGSLRLNPTDGQDLSPIDKPRLNPEMGADTIFWATGRTHSGECSLLLLLDTPGWQRWAGISSHCGMPPPALTSFLCFVRAKEKRHSLRRAGPVTVLCGQLHSETSGRHLTAPQDLLTPRGQWRAH